MMMGIGNVTELTDVDSAGINMLLMGICQELRIESVLTTNVINWARSSIKECDIARRSVHYAVQHHIPPKRLDDRLVVLRDPKVNRYPDSVLADLASSIRDTNVRLIAQDGVIHFMAAGYHFRGPRSDGDFQRGHGQPAGRQDRCQPRLLFGLRNVQSSHRFDLGQAI